MKINELQIGNWVYESESTQFPMFVTGILKDSDGNGGEVYLDFEGNEGDIWDVNIEDVRPIPITAGLFNHNDFRLLDYGLYVATPTYQKTIDKFIVEVSYNLSVLEDKEWHIRIKTGRNEYVLSSDIQYLHELQNAMRLCGIEWDVKL